jgi:hypothetical protein
MTDQEMRKFAIEQAVIASSIYKVEIIETAEKIYQFLIKKAEVS